MDYRYRALIGVLLGVASITGFAQAVGPVTGSAEIANWLARRDNFVKGFTVNGAPVTVAAASANSGSVAVIAGRPTLGLSSTVAIGGKSVPITTTIKAAAGATGKLASALAKTAGPVGVAVAAYDLFNAIKGYDVPVPATPGAFAPAKIIIGGGKEYAAASAGDGLWYPDIQAAGEHAGLLAYPPGSYWGPTTATCNDTHCYIYSSSPNGPGMYLTRFAMMSRDAPPTETRIPITEDEYVEAIEAAMQNGLPSGVVEGTIKAGLQSNLGFDLDDTTRRVSGPATTGAPTVTKKTNPDGTVETTTTKSNIIYEGNNINVTNSTVVTNHNPVSNTTTTTTSTTENPDLPKETPGLCDLYPDILACQKPILGELAPVALANTNKNLLITKDSGWGPAGGACPAPRTATIMGQSISMPFTLLCDFATMINPILIGFAYLSAAMAFLGIGKRD
jgi:hypothetical protein